MQVFHGFFPLPLGSTHATTNIKSIQITKDYKHHLQWVASQSDGTVNVYSIVLEDAVSY